MGWEMGMRDGRGDGGMGWRDGVSNGRGAGGMARGTVERRIDGLGVAQGDDGNDNRMMETMMRLMMGCSMRCFWYLGEMPF